ncbi:hypothetical protein [uncultured Gordonia sp.]|jgi:hypothetical protein|uniref:hypothetical protein n=1 Tax=uncultured Gordonia sp. TaxID=198437 RepID=UPI002639C9EF|nr:hypothetical protein [uncultured Gordonia sp.]
MAVQRTAKKRTRRPATTPEGRESQLIALAVDVVEQQMLDGTASSQVLTHFLKLGSIRESMERDKLLQEIAVLKAKVAQIDSAANVETLYKSALAAMRRYSGQGPGPDDV